MLSPLTQILGRSLFPFLALAIILGTIWWGPWVSFGLAFIWWRLMAYVGLRS